MVVLGGEALSYERGIPVFGPAHQVAAFTNHSVTQDGEQEGVTDRYALDWLFEP